MVADFIRVEWDSILSLHEGDPTRSFENFDTQVNEIINSHAPLKKLSKKELRINAKPWITEGIRKSIKRRDKLLRKYINMDDSDDKKQIYSRYKQLRNRIVALTKISKKLHYQNYFQNNSKDIKKTWNGIKQIIDLRKCNRFQPSAIFIDHELKSDPTEIANNFNNYFANVGPNLQDKINTTGTDFMRYLKTPNNNCFLFEPADCQEILLLIDSLDENKSTGPSSIPTDILKVMKNNICYPLKELINISFATGIYPSQLKAAKVTPIFKNKGDPLVVSNYRPISLLSNINKIFKKLVHQRLYSFLCKYNVIYELQFGFRSKHSTNHALISLTEMVRKAMDDGKFACGVFIDLQKAFDTVDHTILLKKLEFYGVKGLANNWFKSYLSGRTQFTCINGFNSKIQNMKFGVPQGSVLGPLLFLLYINDLHSAINFSSVHHFADDTNLLVSNISIKKNRN